MMKEADVMEEHSGGCAKTPAALKRFTEAARRREMLYITLSQVPEGTVVTYGQLAELAGLGRAARWVGTQLRNLPDDSRLPWHRVINQAGRLSVPEGSETWHEQCQRLRTEGVQVSNGRVSLQHYRWRP